jgi:ABC transporter family protein
VEALHPRSPCAPMTRDARGRSFVGVPTSRHTDLAVRVRGLRKRFGDRDALRGIDLDVRRGETVALVGPNGAGKTTAVEILEGFLSRSGGEVSVLGADPARSTRAWRDRIGIVMQESEPDPGLTVREAVALYAGYRRRPRPVDETLERVGLTGSAAVQATALSGARGGASTSRSPSSAIPSSCSSTSPPPDSTPPPGAPHGTSSPACAPRVGRSSSPRTTCVRPDTWPTASSCSQAAASSPTDPRRRSAIAIATRPGSASGFPPHAVSPTCPKSCVRVSPATAPSWSCAATLADVEALSAWARREAVDVVDLTVRRASIEDVYLDLTGEGTR